MAVIDSGVVEILDFLDVFLVLVEVDGLLQLVAIETFVGVLIVVAGCGAYVELVNELGIDLGPEELLVVDGSFELKALELGIGHRTILLIIMKNCGG